MNAIKSEGKINFKWREITSLSYLYIEAYVIDVVCVTSIIASKEAYGLVAPSQKDG